MMFLEWKHRERKGIFMVGILVCFVLPGILIGLMIGQGMHEAKERARILKKKRAHSDRRQLYIYDLRNDLAA